MATAYITTAVSDDLKPATVRKSDESGKVDIWFHGRGGYGASLSLSVETAKWMAAELARVIPEAEAMEASQVEG